MRHFTAFSILILFCVSGFAATGSISGYAAATTPLAATDTILILQDLDGDGVYTNQKAYINDLIAGVTGFLPTASLATDTVPYWTGSTFADSIILYGTTYVAIDGVLRATNVAPFGGGDDNLITLANDIVTVSGTADVNLLSATQINADQLGPRNAGDDDLITLTANTVSVSGTVAGDIFQATSIGPADGSDNDLLTFAANLITASGTIAGDIIRVTSIGPADGSDDDLLVFDSNLLTVSGTVAGDIVNVTSVNSATAAIGDDLYVEDDIARASVTFWIDELKVAGKTIDTNGAAETNTGSQARFDQIGPSDGGDDDLIRIDNDIALVSGTLHVDSFYVGGEEIDTNGGSSSQWITSGSDVYFSGGDVGIGSDPSTGADLDVDGSFVVRGGASTTWPSSGEGFAILYDASTHKCYVLPRNFKTSDVTAVFYSGDDLYLNSSESTGNVAIGVNSGANRILYVKQSSSTDPIADAWTTHCLLKFKEDIKSATSAVYSSVIENITSANLITAKRKISDMPTMETFTAKYQQDATGAARAGYEYEKALALHNYDLNENPKFQIRKPQIAADDPSTPESWRSYNDKGEISGLDNSQIAIEMVFAMRYVVDENTALKAENERLQNEFTALEARVAKLEKVR